MEDILSLPPPKQQLAQCLIEGGLPIQSIVDEVGCHRTTVLNSNEELWLWNGVMVTCLPMVVLALEN